MIAWESTPLETVVVAFAAAAAVIALAGTAMTVTADRLADRTGLGEAVIGVIFLGASTSLAGSVTAVAAAWDGYADLAAGNAIGGITVQTAFLCLGDLLYRKANLEHAAASPANLFNCILLIALLSLAVLAIALPWPGPYIHPISVLVVAAYLYGLRQGRVIRAEPMWHPYRTRETRPDLPAEPQGGPVTVRLILAFIALFVVLGAAGLVIEDVAAALIEKTALKESLVGGFFTATATSLPELVITVAAIRRGALTLAVAGILGGNTFDILVLPVIDAVYTAGPVYSVLGTEILVLLALTILMMAVLGTGLVRRERYGFANIGFESLIILALYLAGTVTLWLI